MRPEDKVAGLHVAPLRGNHSDIPPAGGVSGKLFLIFEGFFLPTPCGGGGVNGYVACRQY